jgi:hypothetical protein
MCDECDEMPAAYVAYFRKAGGRHWRPARVVATAPAAIDPWVPPGGMAPVPVEVREVRRFSCDDPRDRASAAMGAV